MNKLEHSQKNPSPRMMPITGRSTLEVLPEKALITSSFSSKLFPRSKDAMASTLDARKNLLDLANEKLEAAEITDSAVSVSAVYNRVETERSRDEGDDRVKETQYQNILEGYQGVSKVYVKVDADQAASAYAALASIGDISVSSPYFFLTEETRDKCRLELLAEAIKDSRITAEAMASAAGMNITGVLFIGKEDDGGVSTLGRASVGSYASLDMEAPMSMDYESNMEVIQEIRPEMIELQESVPVRYAIAPESK
jgi:uncharacterized protein YggE